MAGIVAKNDRTKIFLTAGEEFKLTDKIGSMTNIGDITSTDEEVDVTTLESDAREFDTGYPDNGSLEITQNLTSDEYETMLGYKEDETELKVGLSISNKAGEQVLGLRWDKGKVMSVTLGGMSIGGVITVNTSIRLSGKLSTDFTIPLN